MARWKWKNDSVNNSITGTIDEDSWTVEQDETPYLKEIERERENQKEGFNNSAMKKFCTIPDIVAIELLQQYGIDIHDPLFMHDHMNMKKLKQVIITDYPYLVINK